MLKNTVFIQKLVTIEKLKAFREKYFSSIKERFSEKRFSSSNGKTKIFFRNLFLLATGKVKDIQENNIFGNSNIEIFSCKQLLIATEKLKYLDENVYSYSQSETL
jgi:hypothetical protein